MWQLRHFPSHQPAIAQLFFHVISLTNTLSSTGFLISIWPVLENVICKEFVHVVCYVNSMYTWAPCFAGMICCHETIVLYVCSACLTLFLKLTRNVPLATDPPPPPHTHTYPVLVTWIIGTGHCTVRYQITGSDMFQY